MALSLVLNSDRRWDMTGTGWFNARTSPHLLYSPLASTFGLSNMAHGFEPAKTPVKKTDAW